MLRMRAGLDTLRYWRSARETAERQESKVAATTLAKLRNVRPDIDRVLDAIRRDGLAVIEDYWPREKCALACNEIDRLNREFPAVVQRFSGGSDKRMFGVEAVSYTHLTLPTILRV